MGFAQGKTYPLGRPIFSSSFAQLHQNFTNPKAPNKLYSFISGIYHHPPQSPLHLYNYKKAQLVQLFLALVILNDHMYFNADK